MGRKKLLGKKENLIRVLDGEFEVNRTVNECFIDDLVGLKKIVVKKRSVTFLRGGVEKK